MLSGFLGYVNILNSSQQKKFQQKLMSWYANHKEQHPWRVLWEKTQDPYVVWLSEVMLQQTTIQAVTPAYVRFLNVFPTVQDLSNASENLVRETVKGLGYYRRFGFLHKAAQIVVEQKSWPQTYKQWLDLPGVGEYTAAAVSSIVFGERVGVIDGNVQRVFSRLLNKDIHPLVFFKKNLQILLNEMIDEEKPGDFNQGLMELGQKICRPQEPKCHECPVVTLCEGKKAHRQLEIPTPVKRKAAVAVALQLVIVRKKHKQGWLYGLKVRENAERFLKGTRGFLLSENFKPQKDSQIIGSIKHSITHHKIEAQVYVQQQSVEEMEWFQVDDLEKKLVSSLDQKAWNLFTKK
ncbi:MAG: A/G-specific adenine glycosylase [Oligoflexales bacterium]